MATDTDPTRSAPDARTFTLTFPPSAPAMYVVFALRPGLTGTIVCTLTANAVEAIQPLTIDYGPTNSWGDFKITSRGTFVAGDYQATLTYAPTGEVVTVDFTVK
jgi:hypothetical protein